MSASGQELPHQSPAGGRYSPDNGHESGRLAQPVHVGPKFDPSALPLSSHKRILNPIRS